MKENVKLVNLDPHNLDHLTLMYTVRTHPDVDKQLCNRPPENFAQHVKYLDNSVKSGSKLFFLIGFQEHLCGYCHITLRGDSVELGWAVHPSWWGKGIGKASVMLLIEFVQESGLGASKAINIIVKKDNTVALSLYQKCGFVIIGETEGGEYSMQHQIPAMVEA